MWLLLLACSRPTPIDHVWQLEERASGGFELVATGGDATSLIVGVLDGTDEYALDRRASRLRNYPGDEGFVLASGTAQFAVVTIEGVGVFAIGDEEARWRQPAAGVDEGVLTYDGGVVVLGADCTVRWFREDGDATQVAASSCSAFTADQDRAVAFVAGTEGIQVATEAGEITSFANNDADFLEWNDDGRVYGATLGSDTVFALDDTTGSELWSIAINGGVMALAAFGISGVAVSTELENGMGEVAILGEGGATVASMLTPSAAGEVRASDDGRWLALGLPNEVHIFAMDLP